MGSLNTIISGGCTIIVDSLSKALDTLLSQRRVIAITDANIDRLYHDLVVRFDHIIIGHGEANKNLHTVQSIYSKLVEMGADRSTFILGIGGGIVTDIAGFVAATYMRGVEFGFISTTLLGQVDASIGGKNGVNVADYKNMVGTFAQPRFVLSDVAMLRTLPLRELRAGMAEVVKMGVLGDAELFDYIEQHCDRDIYTDSAAMQYVVERCVRQKMHIVECDERESGIRRKLNLGHTIGHAIEKCTSQLNHGEAVAVGLSVIARAAVHRGMLSVEDAERIGCLLTGLGFDIEPPVAMANIVREVRMDKKRANKIIRVVMPCKIGMCEVVEMTFAEFESMF